VDRFDAMTVFARVVEAGSLSAAARSIPMSLTSVSRHLAALEQRLGTQLLRRTTRHLSLTDEGRLVYEQAKTILSELQEMEMTLSASRSVRAPAIAAGAAGLLLGWAIFLNYGLTLMAILAVAVLVSAPERRAAWTTAAVAVLAAAAVAAVFAWAGFWWYDGYTLVQQRYWQGIANARPFQYWSWANLASVVCAIGLGGVAGVSRVFDLAAIRKRSGIHLLVLAALIAIVCADLSMLSKAETERIWLPFTVWLTAAPALLPSRRYSGWYRCITCSSPNDSSVPITGMKVYNRL